MTRGVDIICCPYDSGRMDWRCGLGPARILKQMDRLHGDGWMGRRDCRLVTFETHVDYETDSGLVFEAQRLIAVKVAASRTAGRLPVVLAGNCNAVVGAVAGVEHKDLGMLWFDAHGDFCTPETTDGGFLDGMGLAMVVGRCWQNVLSTVPGFATISERATALIGGRDFDPWEIRDLKASAIQLLSVEQIRREGARAALNSLLTRMSGDVSHVYLHVDIDVLDPSFAPANHYNAPGGLELSELLDAISTIAGHFSVSGGGISSYDPGHDRDGVTAAIAAQVVSHIMDVATPK